MFELCNFKISKHHFENIFVTARNITEIDFEAWIIDSKDVIFPQEFDYKLKRLQIDMWGWNGYSNWETNPEKLTDFIKAISKWSLKKSLRNISFYESGISLDFIRKILKQYKLNKSIELEGN